MPCCGRILSAALAFGFLAATALPADEAKRDGPDQIVRTEESSPDAETVRGDTLHALDVDQRIASRRGLDVTVESLAGARERIGRLARAKQVVVEQVALPRASMHRSRSRSAPVAAPMRTTARTASKTVRTALIDC